MAKKASKKARKSPPRCLGCDRRMGTKDVACRKCGRMRPGSFQSQQAAVKFAPVGGPAFIVKSCKPRCTRCHKGSPADARFCVHCGGGLMAVVKSAADVRRDTMLARFYTEDNPELAEAYWRAAHPEISFSWNGSTAS